MDEFIDIDKLKKHKFIVLCGEHYTPLGVIRSLGEEGINPIVIVIRNKRSKVASKSKYIAKTHFVNSIKEQYDTLVSCYGNEEMKPFVYPCDDAITASIS